jgi:tetratricopeptide (TPR) repeat protein
LLAAHEHGVVHCDIKPSNICVKTDGSVKILDFGLAHLRERGMPTASTLLQGTPAYMAPEQISGGSVDPRTDIWAFGVVLYEMLTQRRPFRGEHTPAVMYSILNEEPPELSTLRADAPAALRTLCVRCLEKDPDRRIQSMDEVLKMLGEEKTVGAAHVLLKKRRERIAAFAILILTIVSIWYVVERWVSPPRKEHASWRVAILPFQNVGDASEVQEWGQLVQALFVRELTGVENMGIVDPVSLNDFIRRSLGGFNGSRTSGFYATLQRADIGYVMDGNILKKGERYLLSLHVVDPVKSEVRFSDQKEFSGEADLPDAVFDLTGKVLDFFRVQVLQVGKDKDLRPWTQQRRQNITAVRAFMQASELIYRGEPGAEKYLRQAIELDSAFISARVWLVSVLATREDTAEARKHYEELVKQESRASPFEQAMIGWAGTYLSRDRRSQLRFLKLALEFSPNNNILLYNLAMVHGNLGEYEPAIEVLRPAIEAKWEYPDAYYLFGVTLFELGKKQMAKEVLQNSLSIEPVHPLTYGLLSVLYRQEGDSIKAERFEQLCLKSSQKKGKGSYLTLAGLAHLNLLQGDFERAANFYRKAYEMTPKQIALLGRVAEALMKGGNLAGAAEEYHRILRLDSTWYKAHLGLANIFETTGDSARAIFHYGRYLERDSTSDRAAEIKQKLLQLRH